MSFDVCVIGGGAAGLMAAGTAANRGLRVLLLERNERTARKVMITGKGRCNVTNNCSMLNELIENVPTNGSFLYSSFSRFMPSDTIDFFENLGVPLKIERGNRVFPVSDKAADIADALLSFARNAGVKIIHARAAAFKVEDGIITAVVASDGERFSAEKYILATGGKSYPLTGSTGDGYYLASSVGHTIIPVKPSLVPLETQEDWVPRLQGLSLKNIAVKAIDNDTFGTVYEDFGEMLFTHFGVSGPVILSLSSHLKDVTPGKYSIEIDLKPALSLEQLDARILREFKKYSTRTISNVLGTLLPRKMIPVAVQLSEIPPDLRVNQITREMRQNLGVMLKGLTVTVKGLRPIEEAIITSGGINVNEIDPRTMRSKLCSNLYFAGEIIDVDAYTGGFNLQIAFSTGNLAGLSV